MKKNILYLMVVAFLSCAESDNAIDRVNNTVTTGAVLATTQINNLTLDKSDLSRPVSFDLELRDGNNGNLLRDVEIFISYDDRTLDNGDNSNSQEPYSILTPEDFVMGENNLPVTTIEITPQEILDFYNFSIDDVSCTDRFQIDFTLNLTNGNSFNHENSIGPIISFTGAIRSPFTYDIYVVNGVDEEFLTGQYTYSSIQDGFDGSTFSTPELVELTASRPNARSFEVFRDMQTTVQGGVFVRAEIDFTIACDQIILSRYVRSAIICSNEVEGDQHVLLGPQINLENTTSIIDDTVFDLRYIEAFEGNDGLCGWPETNAIIRFSKQ